jgi:hypothetical protein
MVAAKQVITDRIIECGRKLLSRSMDFRDDWVFPHDIILP